MLVSWKWLSRYVDLSMDVGELEDRLSFSGLNHESTERVGDDVVIDLEVTSNRGDCLGHLGVAREIGVLYDLPVRFPEPSIESGGAAVESSLGVENRFPEACPRYTARLIRGVRVGPSPGWVVAFLEAVGIRSVNNVVDATNYVMFECGQPLHAFDYADVSGNKIVVRPAAAGETMKAIDHREYTLEETMCVIADAERASAVAGVMGGAESEVSESTRDLVIEAAVFTPLSVRRTARALKLHSPSSYRFERRVDPAGVDWASRRVCQLIVEWAGGEVAPGVIDTAPKVSPRSPVVLREGQLERILGVRIEPAEVERILLALGCVASQDGGDASVPQDASGVAYVPPSWRHDLAREADLIEEVARVHGYDKIPSDSPIPVTPSGRRPFDTSMERVRGILTASGLSEAMTPSVVTQRLDESVSPWTDLPSLRTQTSMLEGAQRLRRSLIPSLLSSRGHNSAAANLEADLFEIAHIYLPGDGDEALPTEEYCLGMVSGIDFYRLKGIVEALCERMGVTDPLTVESCERPGFAGRGAIEMKLGETRFGYLGLIDESLLKRWKISAPVVAAELSLSLLVDRARLVPQQRPISPFPSIERDLNFVLGDSVRWDALERTVRASVGSELADVTYRETYRDASKDGEGRKRVLFTVQLQSHQETLSGDRADALVDSIVEACRDRLQAELLR